MKQAATSAVDPRAVRTRNDVLATSMRVLIVEGWDCVTLRTGIPTNAVIEAEGDLVRRGTGHGTPVDPRTETALPVRSPRGA